MDALLQFRWDLLMGRQPKVLRALELHQCVKVGNCFAATKVNSRVITLAETATVHRKQWSRNRELTELGEFPA